jgi:phosphate butyryltransferase
MIRTVQNIVETAQSNRTTRTLSIAASYEPSDLEAVAAASRLDIAGALLFGDESRIMRIAEDNELDLGTGITIIDMPDDTQALHASIDAVKEKKADVVGKGLIPTSTVIRAVLEREGHSLREGKLLSHVAAFDAPVYNRLMLLTDAGVNITPNMHRKIQIVSNAITVAQALGISHPKVALLAAVDKLNYPAMRATLDAALIAAYFRDSGSADAFVEGPFALDNAVSLAAAATKGKAGDVAGCADILVAPEIETANVLYKALQTFCRVTFAGVVVGIGPPVVVPSRADSPASKLASIALACLLT